MKLKKETNQVRANFNIRQELWLQYKTICYLNDTTPTFDLTNHIKEVIRNENEKNNNKN